MALSAKLPHLFTGRCHCGAIAVRLALLVSGRRDAEFAPANAGSAAAGP